MKRSISLVIIFTFLITTLTDYGRLAFAVTLGSGSTASGTASSHLGSLQESAGPVQSFQTDLFTGRAQTSIPIFTPPGRKNIQPSLNLSYSSSGGASWAGTGWSLDLGFIQRDVKKGTPQYSAQDTYVFSYQGVYSELVSIGTNEYRAKDEALFLKFIYDSTNNLWTVTDKSGTNHYFGETPSSRIEFIGKGTFKWALSKVKDTSGNYMTVSYTTDQGELYLSSIEYNGNETQSLLHTHKVDFTLEDRTDAQTSYLSGGKQKTAKRLREIQVKVKDNLGVYKLGRKYTLAYNNSPSTLRSRLTSVTECGTRDNGTTFTCLPSVTFTYQDKPLEFESFGNFGSVVNDSNVGTKGSLMRNVRDDAPQWMNTWADTMDLDGDALPDRIQKKSTGGKWAFFKNEQTHFQSTAEVANIDTVESDPHGYYSRAVSDSGATRVDFADLNGDGFADRVMSLGSVNSTWYWQKNLGGTFSDAAPIATIASADGSANQHRINHTTKTGFPTTYAEFIDMNGDGLLDRVMKVDSDTDKWRVQFGSLDSNGNPEFNSATTDFTGVQVPSGGSASVYRHIRYYDVSGQNNLSAVMDLIDLNGDGLPDRVMVKPADNTKWQVQYNNGSSFEPPEDWGGTIEQTGSGYFAIRWVQSTGLTHVDLVDINSDGLPDRVVYNTPVSWHVQHNTGAGFGSSQTLAIQNPTQNSNYNYMRMSEASGTNQGADLMDLDGDGLIDRLISEDGAGSWYIQKGKGPYPDLLSVIDNSRGGKTTITYTPSTSLDNKDTSGTNRLPFVVQVVTQVKQEDGLGNQYLTNYSYKGGMYEGTHDGGGYPKREFRGFREVTVTDSIGAKTIHTFGQDDHNKGKLLTKEVKDSTLALFSKEITTWSDTHPYPDVHFVFVSEQKSQLYDGDSSFKETTQTFTYDAYGNLASTTENGDTSLTGDERKTTNDYVYNTTDYIVNTLKQTTLYDSDLVTRRAERVFYYDGAATITAPPVKGLLTREQEWLNTCAGIFPDPAPGACHPATSMTYDSYGNVLTITDARGYVTTNTYESTYRLFLVSIVNALGHSRSFSYDPWIAQILTSTDQNNQVTTTNYDPLGRVVKVISPEDSSTEPTQEFIYDLSAVPNKTTTKIKTSKPSDPYTYLTVYSFTDGLGREIQRRSPAEDSTKQVVTGIVTFDSRGQIKEEYVPYFENLSTSHQPPVTSNPKAAFTYDAIGRRTRIDYPDGTNSQVSFSDFVKTTTDPRGKQLRYTNDAFGRLVKVEEFNSGSTYATTYEYDVLNNLKKTIDSIQNSTFIIYDSLSRKVEMTDPDMGTWSYAYDNNDNLTSQTDAKNQTIRFTYDSLNRVTLKNLPGIERDVTYSYDTPPSGFSGQTGYWAGRLAKVTDASGTHEFKYDKLGRVVSDKKTVDSVGYQFNRTYDSMGRVRTLTYPDTEVVTYTYNGFGDIETITGIKNQETSNYILDVNYNASGQATFTKYGNNVTSDYAYDPETLRLSNILTKKPDGVTKLQDLSYSFDNVGNVTHISDLVNSMTQDFTYDDLNRLIQATGSAYGTKTYAYNSIGNMTQKGNLTLSYGVAGGKPHAVTQVSWSSGQGPSYCSDLLPASCFFSYDANGNMTGRGGDTLSYDSENRLKEITAYEGTTGTQTYTLKPGWNVVSFSWLPDNKSVSSVLSGLVFGTDYDQVSTWDSSSSSWKHWVNDPDFNDFTEFQRGKTYEIYNKTAGDLTFSITGKSSGPNITHNIVSGDNFISPAVKEPTAVSLVLASLLLGSDYSDVKRFNATSQTWESYAQGQFSQFDPGKGYNIIGLATANFSYGNTQQTTTMVYDSTGSRTKKQAAGNTTVYLGKDYEVESTVTTKHIFLGDRRITTKKSNGDIFFIHTDHINSSNVVTDSSGNQSILLEYDPYGETVTQTGSADLKHKYTGQERDDSSHLYYYNARYYDPQIGRFITADPTVQHPTDPQDLNRYAYARNNPIIFTDPTGLGWFSKFFKKLFRIAIAIAVVAAAIFIGAVIGAYVAAQIGGLSAISTGAFWGGVAGGALGGAGLAHASGGNPVQGAISGMVQGYSTASSGFSSGGAGGGGSGAFGSEVEGQTGFILRGVREAVGSLGLAPKLEKFLDLVTLSKLAFGNPTVALPSHVDLNKNLSKLNEDTRTIEKRRVVTFYHYGYAAEVASFASGLRQGAYASPDFYTSGTEAREKLQLQHHAIAPDARYEVTVDLTKTLMRGPMPVLDKRGKATGGSQVIFPEGTPPGSVGPPEKLQK